MQLSFQTFSGIYEFTDSPVVGLLVDFQYVLGFAVSLNCVPPTATVNGVDASIFTEAGGFAGKQQHGNRMCKKISLLNSQSVMHFLNKFRSSVIEKSGI